jgi:L-lactate dehydrogenase complex protein LldG
MDDRDQILKRLTSIRPEKKPPGYLSRKQVADDEMIRIFIYNLEQGGGKGIYLKKKSLPATLKKLFSGSDEVLNLSDNASLNALKQINKTDFGRIDHIDLLLVDGLIGVSENGAVWLTGDCLGDRRFPFITHKMVIILNKKDLVFDLSQAYRRIDLSEHQFGIWIAGPSKTADIEQSLVIGAQGATQHTVIITD